MAGTRNQYTRTPPSKSFNYKGPEGGKVRHILISTSKYISVDELRKPAQVTDRLRLDNADLMAFDRNSMKNAVRRFLLTREVEEAVRTFWNDHTSSVTATGAVNGNNMHNSNSDDEIVCVACFCLLFVSAMVKMPLKI